MLLGPSENKMIVQTRLTGHKLNTLDSILTDVKQHKVACQPIQTVQQTLPPYLYQLQTTCIVNHFLILWSKEKVRQKSERHRETS